MNAYSGKNQNTINRTQLQLSMLLIGTLVFLIGLMGFETNYMPHAIANTAMTIGATIFSFTFANMLRY